MSSRYITYIVQFFVNLYIAGSLGPAYYGIWSFLILVYHFFNIFDLGIPQAVQVLIVHNKNEKQESANIEKTGTLMMILLALFPFVVAIYYSLGGIPKAHELKVGWLFYAICFCGAINYMTNLYDKIYRCRNRLLEIGFKQTSVVFFMVIAIFIFRGKNLLYGLVLSYLVWCVSSFIVFLTRGGLDFSGLFSKTLTKDIFKKGFYLFLFYSGFSLIMITTRTYISINYSIDDFGLFSFSYSLGHAVFQSVQAFSTVIITKLLDRYHSPDRRIILNTIKVVRDNYVSMFQIIIYLAMLIFPIILNYMPKYFTALISMNLCALMMVLYTNSFGYSTYLVASNKEKVLAFIAVLSIFINLFFCTCLIKVFHVPFDYVVFSTMLTYFVYAYLCTFWGRKGLNLSINFFSVLFDCFPLRLFIPFVAAIVVALMNIRQLTFIPIVVFVFMNIKTIKSMYIMIKKMIVNPNIVDI